MSSLREECGVFGVYSPEPYDVAHMTYYGLFALQHRGQESCGIVVNDDGLFRSYKDLGLVNDVFTTEQLRRLGEGQWQAEMGCFSAMAADLPAVGVGEGPLVYMTVEAAGRSWDAAGVSMGNPHCVVEWPDENLPTGMDLAAIGPDFEKNKLFPEGVNTEFIYVRDATHLKMRVWERGSGETMACGTGACASAVAMVLRGISPRDVPIEIELLGGKLEITVCSDDHVLMSGPTATAFTGEAEVD